MLTPNVKQQINTARDILVGKIPDPKGQIDQITNALIYKFMDDQDRLAETLPGGKASFFIEDLKPYAWHKLFDGKLSNQDKANLYVDGIAKLSRAKHLPSLFQDIFKDAFLPFRAPDTIAMFLSEINKFDYHHSEELGNAFEYLLQIMGTQGDVGQFRTPRNIINFIVDVVDPKKDETILDPACGTAGFLIEAYKHINEEQKLTQNEVQDLAKNIKGVDIDPGMAKIARVNLYLHGFKTPLVTEDDTLSDEKLWGPKYDVILANPPFMTPKGGIVPHDKFSVKSNRAEVLFTDYIAEHLKLAGRAGIVVPEGIIFQSGNAYKELRKKLIEENYLWAVVSLPAGVFNPYSGVKTSILLLDRKRAAENPEILFYKVDSDGFDLGAQRREVRGSNLPEALKVLELWRNGQKLETTRSLYIEKLKIAENGEYNLSADRYRLAKDYTNVKWPVVELGNIAEILKGSPITKKSTKVGNIPVIAGGQEPAYYHAESNRNGEIITVSASGAYAGFINYFDTPIFASDCSTIQTKDSNIASTKYLYGVLKAKQEDVYALQQGGAQPHVYPKDLKSIQIPLPPVEIQDQVVTELNHYTAIIGGAKQIAQNWKPKIEIDPEWEKVEIGEICSIERGASPRPIDKFITDSHDGFNWVKIGDTKNSKKYITQTAERVTKEGAEKSRKVSVGDFILSNSMSFGHPYIMKIEGYIHDGWLRLTEDPQKIGKDYMYYILSSDIVMDQFERVATGGVVRNLNSELVRRVVIPLPSLEVQEEIVAQIEFERDLVDAAEKLIDIYTRKMKEVVAKLWRE